MTSGTKAPVLMNSFFLLNLLIFSDLMGFSDIELACDGCGLGALGVVLAVGVFFAFSMARFLLFNFQNIPSFYSYGFDECASGGLD